MTISQQLREAIRNCGVGLTEVAKGSGVTRAAIWRFLAADGNHRDIRLEGTADKLAKYLGLGLQADRDKPAAAKLVKAKRIKAKPIKRRSIKPKPAKPKPVRPAKPKRRST
jgi:Mg-chelatase subunit ChlI